MSLRFRKSINLTKGVKLNFNKNSVSLTTGTKGAHFTVNSKGNTTTSVGIPGSGLSYVNRSSQSTNTTSKPIQLDNNICFDDGNLLISGTKVTHSELENKIADCNSAAILYVLFSFTVFPTMGLLTNVILSFFIHIPYFVIAFVTCIAGLIMAGFKLMAASDYKHTLKLYQMYMDKQEEKNEPNDTSSPDETYSSILETSNSEETEPITPLLEQTSEDILIKDTAENDVLSAHESEQYISETKRFIIEREDTEPITPLSEQPSEDIPIKDTAEKGVLLTCKLEQYFEEAGRLCIEKKRASIGIIMRFYKLDFNQAARIMDQLCDAGVVGVEEGTKPRKILMTINEFEDYLERLRYYQFKSPITETKVETFKNTELYDATTVEYKEIKKYPPEILYKIKDKFIAIDVETTGLDEYSDYIVEISAVIFKNMKMTPPFSTLIYSPIPISEEASEVNNLTDDMLKDALPQNAAMLQFAEFIRDALNGDIVLVAHNSYFDYKFIREAFKRCGINATLLMDDTLRLSETYLNARTNRLSDVARHLGIKYPRRHRAEKDAITCGKIYTHFINQYLDNKKYNPFI